MTRSSLFQVVLAVGLVTSAVDLRAEVLTLTTPRGAVVEVIAELPVGPGPFRRWSSRQDRATT